MGIHTYLLLESGHFLEPLLRNRITTHIGICIGKEIVPKIKIRNVITRLRISHGTRPFIYFGPTNIKYVGTIYSFKNI